MDSENSSSDEEPKRCDLCGETDPDSFFDDIVIYECGCALHEHCRNKFSVYSKKYGCRTLPECGKPSRKNEESDAHVDIERLRNENKELRSQNKKLTSEISMLKEQVTKLERKIDKLNKNKSK